MQLNPKLVVILGCETLQIEKFTGGIKIDVDFIQININMEPVKSILCGDNAVRFGGGAVARFRFPCIK